MLTDDAYGNLLNFNPANALTNLLYSGEIFDQRTAMQYLRARYYNPANGTFNRLDPFFGNLQDPQSLHKYLYVHGDPVQGVDPSGLFSVLNVCTAMTGRQIAVSGDVRRAQAGFDAASRFIWGKTAQVWAARAIMEGLGPGLLRQPDAIVFSKTYTATVAGVPSVNSLSPSAGLGGSYSVDVLLLGNTAYKFVAGGGAVGSSGMGSSWEVGVVYGVKSPQDYSGYFVKAAGAFHGLANPIASFLSTRIPWLSSLKNSTVGAAVSLFYGPNIVTGAFGLSVGPSFGSGTGLRHSTSMQYYHLFEEVPSSDIWSAFQNAFVPLPSTDSISDMLGWANSWNTEIDGVLSRLA